MAQGARQARARVPMEKAPVRIPNGGLAFLCIVIALLVFAPVVPLGFLSDDLDVVHRVGVLHDLRQGGMFRPMQDLTVLAIHAMFGADPIPQRVFNIILHGLCAYLLFRLLLGIGVVRNGATWMGALLFLVYPFHGEAVIWIVGRSVSMAALFMLLGLLALLPSRHLSSALFVSSVCWFLALMSYESAVLFPLLALPLLLRRSTGLREVFPFMASWVVAFALYLTIRWIRLDQLVNEYGSNFLQHAPKDYLLNALYSTSRLFLPPGPLHRPWIMLGTLVGIVLCTILVMRARNREHGAHTQGLPILPWMFLVSMLTPVLVGVSTETSEGDRALYTPSLFLCAMVAIALAYLPTLWLRRSVLLGVLVAALVLLIQLQQNWRHASRTLDTIVLQLQELQAIGTTWVVHVPEEHDGAFILRHGLRPALELQGIDGERFVHAGRLRRYATLHAPDTIRPTRTPDGVLLEPGVRISTSDDGPRLITPFHDVALRTDDRVLYWDRHRMQVLWPATPPR